MISVRLVAVKNPWRPSNAITDLATARRLLGPDAIIGVTASNAEEAIAAAYGGADYLGIGTVYATPTSIRPSSTSANESNALSVKKMPNRSLVLPVSARSLPYSPRSPSPIHRRPFASAASTLPTSNALYMPPPHPSLSQLRSRFPVSQSSAPSSQRQTRVSLRHTLSISSNPPHHSHLIPRRTSAPWLPQRLNLRHKSLPFSLVLRRTNPFVTT